MPYRQDLTTGEWVEVDASGNPLASNSYTVAPNPTRAAQEQREADRQAVIDAAAAEERRIDNARADRELILRERTAPQSSSVTPVVRADALQAFTDADALERAATEIETAFNAGPGTTSRLGGVFDYFPTAENRAMNDAAQRARGYVKRALGFTGGEGNTVAESSALYDPYLPTAGNFDSNVAGKIGALRRLAQDARARSTAILGGVPDANGNITPLPNAMTQDRLVSGATPAPLDANGTTTRDNAPPEVQRAHADLIARLMAENGGRLDPQTYAREWGALSQQMRGDSVVPRDPNADAAWAGQVNQYLDQGGNSVPTDVQDERNVSDSQQALNSLLMTKPGTTAMNLIDSAAFGGVSALAGDRMGALNEREGGAALLGQIGGAITATGALGKLGKQTIGRVLPGLLGGGVRGNVARNVVTDMAYSGIYGANTGESGTGSAVEGGLGSLLGQFGGKLAGKALGGLDVSPAVDYLRQRGIPLTVGQSIGGAAKKLEEAATSIPFVGNQIGNRFDDGLAGVNRAAFDVAAQTTGGRTMNTGSAGLDELRGLTGQQYRDALDPVSLDIAGDPMALGDISNAQLAAYAIPQVGSDAADALAYRVGGGMDPLGGMDGRDFQEAYRGLARDGRAAANGPYANEFAGVMSQGQDALAGTLERQNPGAFGEFQAANTANRRTMVLADAVNSAKNQGNEIFTPAQLNAADANSATRLTGRLNSATGNRPFHELATNAQEVMGNRLPNSGTADRAALMAGLGGLGLTTAAAGGAGYMAGDTQGAAAGASIPAIAVLLALAGGTKGGQKLLTGALTQRPDQLRRVGRGIGRRAGMFGSAAIPLALTSETGL